MGFRRRRLIFRISFNWPYQQLFNSSCVVPLHPLNDDYNIIVTNAELTDYFNIYFSPPSFSVIRVQSGGRYIPKVEKKIHCQFYRVLAYNRAITSIFFTIFCPPPPFFCNSCSRWGADPFEKLKRKYIANSTEYSHIITSIFFSRFFAPPFFCNSRSRWGADTFQTHGRSESQPRSRSVL